MWWARTPSTTSIRVWSSNDVIVEDNQIVRGRDVVLWYSERLTVRGNVVRGGRYETGRGNNNFQVIGRLADGVDLIDEAIAASARWQDRDWYPSLAACGSASGHAAEHEAKSCQSSVTL